MSTYLNKGKFIFLVCPVNATGPINACLGTVSQLVENGHLVFFVVEKAFEGKLLKHGVKEIIYTVPSRTGTDSVNALAQAVTDLEQIGPLSPKEKAVKFCQFVECPQVREEWKIYDQTIYWAIHTVRPTCIITDENGLMPSIYFSNIPWIRHLSCNPLIYFIDPELPPGGSGLPFNDHSEWNEFNSVRQEHMQSKSFVDYMLEISNKVYPYPENYRTPNTQLFTVYACPKEWNYPPLQNRENWFNIEVFNKNAGPTKKAIKSLNLLKVFKNFRAYSNDLNNVVPRSFSENSLNGKFSGKMVYVSMGSIGSKDLNLMRRLLGAFSKTNHKYIVSKGPRHAEIELPVNCWGEEYLPQASILPLVDLVITHGGNNTVTETFAQGKPMLVLPLYGDQYDNAQRLHETGYGMKLDPYRFTDTELVNAIDKVLSNAALKNKVESAGKRIQQANQHSAFAEYAEKMIKHHQATTPWVPKFFNFHVY